MNFGICRAAKKLTLNPVRTEFSVTLVPMAGLEPAHIAAVDFESTVSAIPPHRHIYRIPI